MIYKFSNNAIPLLGLRIVLSVSIHNHELIIKLHDFGEFTYEVHSISLIFLSASEIFMVLSKKTNNRLILE